jgi:hypothetical protein
MAKEHLKLITPAIVNRTVTPKRPPNADLRTREYLTEAEVERLMTVARKNRWGHRDATMILVAYRHGLHTATSSTRCGTLSYYRRGSRIFGVNSKLSKSNLCCKKGGEHR